MLQRNFDEKHEDDSTSLQHVSWRKESGDGRSQNGPSRQIDKYVKHSSPNTERDLPERGLVAGFRIRSEEQYGWPSSGGDV